jgi:radical SAM protein with 4Fe4S-binding SPASM domain
VKFQVGFCCNLACSFCLIQAEEKTCSLNMHTVDNAFKDLALQKQIKRVVITGGEPTLPMYMPITLDIIKKAKSLGAESTIYTNGTLLNNDNLKELRSAGLTEIRLSVYEPINWEKINNILDEMENNGFSRFLKVTVTRQTYPKLKETLEKLPNLKPTRFQIKPFNQTGIKYVDEIEEMTPDQVLEMAKIMLDYKRNVNFRIDLLPLCYEFLVEDVPTDNISVCNCGKGKDGYLVINPNGDVFPCGAYSENIGNVNDPNYLLTEAWKKSLLLKTIRNLSKEVPDECKNCQHLKKCQINDCHSTTFNYYGNLKRGNPQCPILAKERFKL